MNRTRLTYRSFMTLWMVVSAGCAAAPPCETPSIVAAAAPQSTQSAAASNSALQHKVKAQEKRISELSMQLDLFKRIDQDHQRQR